MLVQVIEDMKALGVLEPLPVNDLSPAKMRLVSSVTGWNTSVFELMGCPPW